jgi:hypothetical protein
MLMN